MAYNKDQRLNGGTMPLHTVSLSTGYSGNVLLYPVNWWSFDLLASEIISPTKLCSTLPHELMFCRGVFQTTVLS